MNTTGAFMMGMMNRGREQMVFDWDKAARIIKEKGLKYADAGLAGDFENTGGTILYEGKPITDSYTYLASTWATPILVYHDESEESDEYETMVECYVMASNTEWNHGTKWPESALKILGVELA